jgi:putative ABC transport system substrate-binding protein
MNKREFIAGLGSAAAWPLVARAQQQPKVWRIGMLETISADLNATNLGAFQQSMRHLGYVEGQNLVIEYRSADGDAKRLPGLVAELIHLNVDLIVTRGTPAALAAKKANQYHSRGHGGGHRAPGGREPRPARGQCNRTQ